MNNKFWIGKPIQISGWGYVNETMKDLEQIPEILQHATLDIWVPIFSDDFGYPILDMFLLQQCHKTIFKMTTIIVATILWQQ